MGRPWHCRPRGTGTGQGVGRGQAAVTFPLPDVHVLAMNPKEETLGARSAYLEESRTLVILDIFVAR